MTATVLVNLSNVRVSENGQFGVKVILGAKTESIPLGELKKLARPTTMFDRQMSVF